MLDTTYDVHTKHDGDAWKVNNCRRTDRISIRKSREIMRSYRHPQKKILSIDDMCKVMSANIFRRLQVAVVVTNSE
jgi:hypothetical protein